MLQIWWNSYGLINLPSECFKYRNRGVFLEPGRNQSVCWRPGLGVTLLYMPGPGVTLLYMPGLKVNVNATLLLHRHSIIMTAPTQHQFCNNTNHVNITLEVPELAINKDYCFPTYKIFVIQTDKESVWGSNCEDSVCGKFCIVTRCIMVDAPMLLTINTQYPHYA